MRRAMPQVRFVVTALIVIAVAAPLFGDDSATTKNSEKLAVVRSDLPKTVDLRPVFSGEELPVSLA